jgi:lipoprotein-releasing system ATP-binding protein
MNRGDSDPGQDGAVILSAQGIHKVFETDVERLHVLRGVDLEVERGQIICVVGPSGVGKSTLLHILGTLDRPTEGSVRLNSEDLFSRDDRELAIIRNRYIGFVFQYHHLLPDFTARENILIPVMIQHKISPYDIEKASLLLRTLGLTEREHHRPAELSAGERQRVAIAKALINDPLIVFADEPTGSLDRHSSEQLYQLMFNLARERETAFLVVTHDESLTQQGDHVYRLEEGQLKEESHAL